MSTPEPDPTLATPADVARLLRARTKDKDGVEVGRWTDETRPTCPEVEGLIELAHGDVLAQTGTMLSTVDANAARSMVALRAAMLVELSYFPEQVRSDRSAYPEYKRLYDDGMAALLGSISEGGGEGGEGGEGYSYHSLPVVPAITALYGYGWPFWDYWPEPENPANWAQPWQPPREPPHPEDLPVGDEPASGETLSWRNPPPRSSQFTARTSRRGT